MRQFQCSHISGGAKVAIVSKINLYDLAPKAAVGPDGDAELSVCVVCAAGGTGETPLQTPNRAERRRQKRGT